MTADVNESGELRFLAAGYGIAMLTLFLNRLFAMPLLWTMISAAGLPNEDSDAYYFTKMLANEAASYLIPLLIFAVLFGKAAKSAKDAKLSAYPKIRCGTLLLFVCGIGAGAAGSLLTDKLIELIDMILGTEKPAMAFSGSMPASAAQFTSLIICTGIIAPICEELIFRHFLLKPLRRYGDITAALTSSLIFALYHANLSQLAYAALVGFFFAVIAVRAGSILPAIAAHVINNLIVGAMNYLPESFGNEQADIAFGTAASALSITMKLVIAAGLIMLIFPKIRGMLRLKTNCGLSLREQIACMLSEPILIGGLIAMLAAFFI